MYDKRHGGPWDRGSADSYYRRPFRPHYFESGTYSSKEIIPVSGSSEYEAYKAGFHDNEDAGDYKDWG